jgi:hypothetical protein
MDDLHSGAWQFLMSFPDVLAVLGSFPADDPVNPGQPWLFQHNIYQRMEAQSVVKGTQATAVVVIYAGQFTVPTDSSTARMQRLEVDIWADPLRDAYGNVTDPSETEGRVISVWQVLDSHLHRASSDYGMQLWGDLVTTSSSRLAEPVPYPVPDGDGLLRGVGYYGVSTFGNNIVHVGSGDSGSGG